MTWNKNIINYPAKNQLNPLQLLLTNIDCPQLDLNPTKEIRTVVSGKVNELKFLSASAHEVKTKKDFLISFFKSFNVLSISIFDLNLKFFIQKIKMFCCLVSKKTLGSH